jgi:hypothetical protein
VAVRVGDGEAVDVSVGVAVSVGVLDGPGVGVIDAVGDGVGVSSVYSILSSGRYAGTPFSFVSKRLLVLLVSSRPISSQPWLWSGLSSHSWTSATISAVDPHV